MTTSNFSIFNYPHKIELVRVSQGYTDQNTGEWVARSEEVVEIKGHVQDISAREINNTKEGIYEVGDRKLYVDDSINIHVGDEVRITESDGTVTTWVIKEEDKKYHFLAKFRIGRRCFILKPKDI